MNMIRASITDLPNPAKRISELESELLRVRAALDEARADLDKAVCVWCGHIGEKSNIAEHVFDCIKNPMGELARQWEIKLAQLAADRDALRAELAEAVALVESYRLEIDQRDAAQRAAPLPDATWNDAVDACAEYIIKNYYPPKWKAFGLAENVRGLKRYSESAALPPAPAAENGETA